MGNFVNFFRSNKLSVTPSGEVPKRRSRILKEIKRTGKTVREIFQNEIKTANLQSFDQADAAHHDAEQLAEESVQPPPSNEFNVVDPSGSEQPAEESLQLAQSNDDKNAARNDAEQPALKHVEPCQPPENDAAVHHSTEQPLEVSAQQTPRTGGNDSGYNSPQDETSAWEKILEMRGREHQNDLAAMQDVHDDEMKYLRDELSSETRRKELFEKRVKKEVLAKQELKRQLDLLQVEHRAAVEASEDKDKEIEEKEMEALALRGRLQEMERGFQNKEKFYLQTIKAQGEEVTAKGEEIHDLRMRIYEMNSDLLNKRDTDQGVRSNLGTNAQNAQNWESATSAQWKVWYHHAFEEAQVMRKELDICTSQREQAISIANDLHAQLELAKTANGKLCAELDARHTQMEVDARYYEQIRGQNWDLQKRINESTVDVARLRYQKAKAGREAAAEVKDLTRKLDNRTAELSALEATRAAWQADPEGVLLTLSKGVTSDAFILALAKRLELTLDEKDSLTQRMAVREQEYDALNAQLRRMKAQRDGLSQSLADKAEEATSLKNQIHELETKVLSREMDEEVDKRIEPLYLRALEEIQQLREAASEEDENAVNSGAFDTQLNHVRRAALQNHQQHVAKAERLKDLIEKVYERMLQLEATLTAAGRTIEEPHNEGDALKAECARVLGYDEAESELEAGGPDNTTSGSDTSRPIDAESQSGDDEDKDASQSNANAYDTGLTDGPTGQSEDESDVKSEAELEQPSDSLTTMTARRFVQRSLAEGLTRTRFLGESSSPPVALTPDSKSPRAEDEEDVPSDRDDGRDDGSDGEDEGEDLQTNRPPPLPVASLAWVNKKRPFRYGEPVGDDQFGAEALRARS